MISSLPGKALRTLVDIARLVEKKRILGECLLISSLPGKASRTLVDLRGLPRYRECLLISSLPGKASTMPLDSAKLTTIYREY